MSGDALRACRNLVMVAGHAVFLDRDGIAAGAGANWALKPYQKGEGAAFVAHARAGAELAAADPAALLVFSGGRTAAEVAERSEGAGLFALAERCRWWGLTAAAGRAAVEGFARDSFENLLFSICRFCELAGRPPEQIGVVSWPFKRERFRLHLRALCFPEARFRFHGAGTPVDEAAADRGEAVVLAAFAGDPYGSGRTRERSGLGDKRAARNPFGDEHRYAETCPELKGLLAHEGPEPFAGRLPW